MTYKYHPNGEIKVGTARIPERVVDIYGDVIVHPKLYHKTVELAKKMIDGMSDGNVDCSDVHVVLNDLFSEILFHCRFKYTKKNDKVNLTSYE